MGARAEAQVLSIGFAPVAAADARVLVLGSLPGRMSLELQQYYGQPRNAFWKLMGRLYDFAPDAPYESRLAALKRCGVALWDVCAGAYRPGSLDADIRAASVRPNDFCAFLDAHRSLDAFFFNGQKAADLFKRLVQPQLPVSLRKLDYVVLPSSSPAHAAMPFAAKLHHWSQVRRASQATNLQGNRIYEATRQRI